MINLKQLLKDEHISKAQLSEILFPKNKFPGRSLLRILKGEAELSVSQVVALSEFTGLSLDQICEPDKWEGDLRDGSHVYLRSKNFRAEIDTKTWTTRIYYKDTLVKEEMISPALPIAEYICTLEKTVQDAKELL